MTLVLCFLFDRYYLLSLEILTCEILPFTFSKITFDYSSFPIYNKVIISPTGDEKSNNFPSID
jgi:hypothetical protein